jgi:glycosyltransferase involved in cell wall biosynthesis
MKVALVHDWLTGMRGGEKCLEVFCELFPDATLFTLLHAKGSVSPAIERMEIRTSALQRMPGAARHYRYYLPLLPAIVEAWDTGGEEYDLVLSSCHAVAKGVKFPRAKRRACYCFTPMRYVWCQAEHYYAGDWKQLALRAARGPLRAWDLRSNRQVDEFLAISRHVAERIRRFYGREAEVVYPPADTEFYRPPAAGAAREDFWLMAGALEPYKRADLAIEAFRRWRRRLVVVGKGTMLAKLRASAPPNVEFLGWQPDEAVRELYGKARGLVFPGEEDFGIVPLEAQACGCPVVAYGVGGAQETVREGETGLFFQEPTVDALLAALGEADRREWDPAALRAQAGRFSRARFREEIARRFGAGGGGGGR